MSKYIFLGSVLLLVLSILLISVGENWKAILCGIASVFSIIAYYGEEILKRIYEKENILRNYERTIQKVRGTSEGGK